MNNISDYHSQNVTNVFENSAAPRASSSLNTTPALKVAAQNTTQNQNNVIENYFNVFIPNVKFEDLPWEKFPNSLYKSCEENTEIIKEDLSDMVHVLAKYLREDLKNTHIQTCDAVAKCIVEKYPNTFAKKINGKLVIDVAIQNLRSKLYDRIRYVQKCNKNKRKNSEKDTKEDQFGMVNFDPLLPPMGS